MVWNKYTDVTSSLAQELSEQLRLVLEPTKASRLQGDFRTGKRINMRRVIPYIASQFKNDKIWLRRTKPSKRQYQIIMAVDNSKSMMDSNAKSVSQINYYLLFMLFNLYYNFNHFLNSC